MFQTFDVGRTPVFPYIIVVIVVGVRIWTGGLVIEHQRLVVVVVERVQRTGRSSDAKNEAMATRTTASLMLLHQFLSIRHFTSVLSIFCLYQASS